MDDHPPQVKYNIDLPRIRVAYYASFVRNTLVCRRNCPENSEKLSNLKEPFGF